MAESAAITVKIDTAPVQAMINELQSARLWTNLQIENLLHWEWNRAYEQGHKDATDGKPSPSGHQYAQSAGAAMDELTLPDRRALYFLNHPDVPPMVLTPTQLDAMDTDEEQADN